MEEIHFEQIDSTNAFLKREHSSLDSFTFVSASMQTAGRGRGERAWLSNKNENLLFSILLKEKDLVDCFPYLSLCAAYSVFSSLRSEGLTDLSIKWPNDVYASGKKISGILLEGSLPEYLVIGIGINVNQTLFEGDYRIAPTSVANQLGHAVDLSKLKALIYSNLSKDIKSVLMGDHAFLSTVRENDFLKGKEKEFVRCGKTIKGICQGIGDFGELFIKSGEEIISISTGEI